jgi:hypothetical protein
MFYDFSITVPANTPEYDPIEQILPLTAGVVQKLSIQFPRGTFALVHVKLLYHEFQVWPTNPDGSFNADGYPLEWEESYELDTEPYEMKAVLWSDADTYDYDINIRLSILRTEDVEKQSGVISALKSFLKLVGVGG